MEILFWPEYTVFLDISHHVKVKFSIEFDTATVEGGSSTSASHSDIGSSHNLVRSSVFGDVSQPTSGA